jgi:hypothetical protein
VQPYWLAAGQRVLVVKNLAAFEAGYPPGLPIAGEYVGSLNNAGDHLVLYGQYGEPILDFTYNNAWYPMSDGPGFSLVAVNPLAPSSQWSSPSNWRASSQAGGSPGADDPAPPTFVPVVVNEILSHPDTNLLAGVMDSIELHNPSATLSADVSGWYLSDDFNLPKKYLIPTPTIIPPGGFVVFYRTNFNDPALGANAFALRAEGEQICLFSADTAGNLTGYFHGDNFGAAAPNVSFGRYLDSQGQQHFVAQSALTLGTNNAPVLVGPVVISEVMYHPPELSGGEDNQVDEFVEIQNLLGETVRLYEQDYPANTWHLRGGVEFHFPAGAQLPAHGYALVVSFDPAVDLLPLAFFRSQYELGTDVLLFGPYGGKLSNDKDNVELAKPVVFGTNTANPGYALVDKLEYQDRTPWPQAADGAGFSLQRLVLTEYGNDPTNWTAATPTPAGALVPGVPPTIVAQPTNQIVLASAAVSLSVTPGGSGPFRYQWRYNGANLEGATNALLDLPAAQIAQSGAYQAVVMNPSGSVESDLVTLTVIQGVAITVQPVGRTVGVGSNATLNVGAFGNGVLSYQWRRNGSVLDSATSPSLVLSNFQLSLEGDYDCVVNDAVSSVTSATARLTALIKPVILQQPQPSTNVVLAGQDASMSAQASGNQPMSIRWRRRGATYTNGVVVNTFTTTPTNVLVSTTLTVTNASYLNNGDYFDVTITNISGSSGTSQRAYLIVTNGLPEITVQPTNLLVNAGSNATFITKFMGNPAVTYQWWYNWTNLLAEGASLLATNQQTNSLTVTNVQATNEGDYVLILNNGFGSVTSAVATLTLRKPPVILVQPVSQVAVVGDTASFSVIVTGTPPFSYRWRFFGTNVPGAVVTNATLTLTNVQAPRTGDYSVVVTNLSGGTTSSVATLTLMTEPLRIDSIVGSAGPTNPVTIGFAGLAGAAYAVEFRDDLSSGTWQPVTNIPPLAVSQTVLVQDWDAIGKPQRFYHVLLLP